jgi:hypothetical protein
MSVALSLVGLLLFAPDDDPKPETPPAPVKEVLDKYLKAVTAKDLKAMAALAEVPWLDRDRQVLRDRTGLDKALERVASQLPRDEGQRKVETFPYKKMRIRIKDESESKLLDSVLGDDGWLAIVEEEGYPLSMRTILIQVKDGKAAVVAGPLKENQITQRNRIPEAAGKLLDKAETIELYSLDPELKTDKEGKVVEVKDGFHGWKVLGKTAVKDGATRKRLADALRLAAEDNFGMVAACFNPRHGLRLAGGGKTVDLVICFECLSVEVYVDGEKKEGFLTTGEPQKGFDAALKTAGVALPKPAKP